MFTNNSRVENIFPERRKEKREENAHFVCDERVQVHNSQEEVRTASPPGMNLENGKQMFTIKYECLSASEQAFKLPSRVISRHILTPYSLSRSLHVQCINIFDIGCFFGSIIHIILQANKSLDAVLKYSIT